MKNKYEIRGDTVVIFIERKNGDVYEALVDTEDLHMLCEIDNSWNVCINRGRVSVQSTLYHPKRTVQLHRVLLRYTNTLMIDHVNGDPLDNRKSNLRLADNIQNGQNRKGAAKHNKLGVRGVYFYESVNKYRTYFSINGKTHSTGYFNTLEDAELSIKEARAVHYEYSEGDKNIE